MSLREIYFVSFNLVDIELSVLFPREEKLDRYCCVRSEEKCTAMDQGKAAEERAAKFRRRMVSDIYDQQPQYIEGRFKDWTKQEMILQLVNKGVTIRNEHQVSLKTIRDLMKSYYEGLDTPPKPTSRYNSLTKNIVDRGIILFQNLVFRYLYKIRLYNTDGGNNQNLLEQNERDFGDAYAGETETKYYKKQGARRQSLGARAGAIQADAEARLTAKEKIGLTAGKLAVSAFSDILGIKSRGIRSNQFQPQILIPRKTWRQT